MHLKSSQYYRDEVLGRYLALSPEELLRLSACLIRSALQFFVSQSSLEGQRVGVYEPFPRTEPQLGPLWGELESRGVRLFYPSIEDFRSPPLRFQHHKTKEFLEASELDWIVVPGLAFCPEDGSRIGRGKGYYDRTLEKAPNVPRLALAMDFQCDLGSLPTHSGDQKMDWLVTPTRVIPLKSRFHSSS